MSLLSSGLGSVEQLRDVQFALEMEYAYQRFSLEKSAAFFSLSGLNAPAVIQGWRAPFVGDIDEWLHEVMTFQEALDARITSLAGNHRMIREHWDLIDDTRDFRIREFSEPTLRFEIVEETIDLMAALSECLPQQALRILTERLKRRSSILRGIPPKTKPVRLQVIAKT